MLLAVVSFFQLTPPAPNICETGIALPTMSEKCGSGKRCVSLLKYLQWYKFPGGTK